MGIINSKGFFSQRQVDEACSNTSLSKLRYVAVEKPKWKVFSKREIRAIPAYNMRGRKGGCPCGSNGPCKLKVTPKGVTMHYPQKNRFGLERRYKPPHIAKPFLTDKNRAVSKVKIVRSKKFAIPTWRLDKISHLTPFQNLKNQKLKRMTAKNALPTTGMTGMNPTQNENVTKAANESKAKTKTKKQPVYEEDDEDEEDDD